MADRMPKALRMVVAARVDRAVAAHARAMRAKADAEAATATADAAISDAGDAWQRHLTERFDPALGTAYARALTLCVANSATATAQRHGAAAATALSAQAWQREHARRRAMETHAKAAARHARHRADERMLATVADRETFKWQR